MRNISLKSKYSARCFECVLSCCNLLGTKPTASCGSKDLEKIDTPFSFVLFCFGLFFFGKVS